VVLLSPPALTPVELLRITHALAVERDRWLALVEHRPDERWFARVESDDDHDVWLIGWSSFQGVDLHDHGGAAGVLYVVDGSLEETCAEPGGSGRLVGQTLETGAARAFGVEHVHRVVNPSPRPATSLHVYSPPLSTMDFYAAGVEGLAHTHSEGALGARSGRGELR
jgi:cysteine dioxygenase type I